MLLDCPYRKTLLSRIPQQVAFALEEDLEGDIEGVELSGDITAQLIPNNQNSQAQIICKQDNAIICGLSWVKEAFLQVDANLELTFHVEDGQQVNNQELLMTISGNTRAILTAERTALNFLQTLSGTATSSYLFSKAAAGKPFSVLDTRKTLPGLRLAQKYAVLVGGCQNHRIGLYDMFLIKENHIKACGGIEQAINQAKKNHPERKIEIEVETEAELKQAIAAKPHIIMLDNFLPDDLEQYQNLGILLETSGNLTLENANQLSTNVDRFSSGQLTKDVTVVDLSLLLKD